MCGNPQRIYYSTVIPAMGSAELVGLDSSPCRYCTASLESSRLSYVKGFEPDQLQTCALLTAYGDGGVNKSIKTSDIGRPQVVDAGLMMVAFAWRRCCYL